MNLTELKPSALSTSVDRVITASERLSNQVQSSITDFTNNHIDRFTEAGTAGGTIIIVSAFGKDAVNTLKLSQNLTPEESIAILTAVGSIKTGVPVGTALAGLTAKESLLTQSFLLAYQIGELEDSAHKIPADFNVTVNPDNSVSTSNLVVVSEPEE